MQGLCFLHKRKWAAGVTYSKEFGFVISKKSKPDGSVVWSGPVFIQGKSYGFGLAAGESAAAPQPGGEPRFSLVQAGGGRPTVCATPRAPPLQGT